MRRTAHTLDLQVVILTPIGGIFGHFECPSAELEPDQWIACIFTHMTNTRKH